MKEVVIRPLDNFSTNGKLSGPLAAFDPDDDNVLLWEGDYPNWRRPGVVDDAAAKMVAEMTTDFPEYGMDLGRAIKALRKGLREARRAQ